jgi:hypothetical protein
MSRYQWPSPVESVDRPLERMRHNALSDGLLLEEAVIEARKARAPAPVEEDAAFIAPTGPANLWVPIGPSTVLHGQAGNRPRVAGRISDIWVSPDGQRAYAATANGGVWFSTDAGTTWSPFGNWTPTPTTGAEINRGAMELACGCLMVDFGAGPAGSDVVYVGTGELIPRDVGTPGGIFGGVGVLRLENPVPADPFGTFWKREAKNLTGYGIFRLAKDPKNADTLVAATSIGLFTRTGAFTENSDWTRVTAAPFNFGAGDGKSTSDVLWLDTLPKPTLWVALLAGNDSGVWFSTNGVAGPFTKVDLPNIVKNNRLGLAASPSDLDVICVLGTGPKLWRVTGGAATEVQKLPSALFGTTQDQSDYDLAIAVQPDKVGGDDVVLVGGSLVYADGDWNAALFKFRVTADGAGGLTAGFADANQGNPAADPTFIGNGVHADVHQVRIVKVGPVNHVWVGCDGGVYRSTTGGERHSFISRNTGLAVLETDYIANHPDNDAFVLTGCQDNSLLMRVGDTVWLYSDSVGGDAGGTVIHPAKTRYFAAQVNYAKWRSNGKLSQPVNRGTGGASEKKENRRAKFYSGPDIIRRADGKVRFAIGTNRVWLADDWDPEAATTTWVTLPSGNDPRLNLGTDTSTDTYGEGTGQVVACKFAAEDRLVALIQSDRPEGKDTAVLLFKRAADGKWPITEISSHSNKKSDYSNGDIPQPKSDYLPPLGSWTDVAIHDPARLPNGSCYVSTTGFVKVDGNNLQPADRMDTLWWYDGNKTWYPTSLRNDGSGTKAPAYAVVCDPADATIVYVGTAIGVWRGVLALGGPTPTWTWQIFSNGLPEAAIEDLSFYRKDNVKILRAAMKSRGIWEVDVSAAPSPLQRTFLRVHANDARRADVTSLTNPMLMGPVEWPWHASPDVRIRLAPLSGGETVAAVVPVASLGLPWLSNEANDFQRWIFQTALHKTDPLCRPDGQYNEQYASRLRNQDAVLGTQITVARWNAVVTAATVFATPWNGAEPTEADLYELIVEDPPDPTLNPAPGPPQISRVKARKYKVDVLAHYRDLRPLPAAQVRLALFRRLLPADATQWPGIAISAAWKTAVQQLMSGSPPGGWAMPDGWTAADSGSRTRQISSDIDARTPRAVTFDVDFKGATVGQKIMLLAVVQSTPDPVSVASLVGDNLKDLILKSHQVAARVVEIRA